MLSLVNDARRFDADVARLQRAFTRLKRIIATALRELDKQERDRHRNDAIYQTYLKQQRRLRRRRREIWLCKLVPLSLALLVLATCRAVLSGAFWLLHYASRLMLVRASALAGRALNFAADRHWVTLAKPRIAFPIAAVVLGAIGVFSLSKPMTPVETVVPIIADSQNASTLTVARERWPERTGTLSSPSLTPGFARVSSSETLPEPLPASGKDIASIMLLMTSLPAPATTSTAGDPAPEATEPPRQRRAEAPATRPRTQTETLVPTEVSTAPTMPSPSADDLEPISEQPERQQSPTRADQRRDFVPHAFW